MKRMYSLFVGLLLITTTSWSMHITDEATLQQWAQRYIDFLSAFGKEAADLQALDMSLFDDRCQKVVNGTLIAETPQAIKQQMIEVKRAIGSWSIDSVFGFPCPSHNCCIVKFEYAPGGSNEKFIVMKVLRFDVQGRVYYIDEVYNKIPAN